MCISSCLECVCCDWRKRVVGYPDHRFVMRRRRCLFAGTRYHWKWFVNVISQCSWPSVNPCIHDGGDSMYCSERYAEVGNDFAWLMPSLDCCYMEYDELFESHRRSRSHLLG